MFEDMKDRAEKFAHIVADAILEKRKKEQITAITVPSSEEIQRMTGVRPA